jgi:hypothetical protein
MTKTRRSLMVFLFMTMVLGAGLFLPHQVSRPVKAENGVQVAVRSSKHPDWQILKLKTYPNGDTPASYLKGFSPYSWIQFRVIVPTEDQILITPSDLRAQGDFVNSNGTSYQRVKFREDSWMYLTYTSHFYYRIDALPGSHDGRCQMTFNFRGVPYACVGFLLP